MFFLGFIVLGCPCYELEELGQYPHFEFITVKMTNKSSLDIHLFISEKESFDPSNKVLPNGSREWKYSWEAQNSNDKFNITIIAGRNGTVLDTKNDEIEPGIISEHYIYATWNGSSLD